MTFTTTARAIVVVSFAMACGPITPPAGTPPPPAPPPTPPAWNDACVVFGPSGPIAGATCTIAGQSALTNGDGYHLFVGVSAGAQTMAVTADGYTPAHVDVSNDHHQDVAVRLQPDVPPLPPVPTRAQVCGVVTHFQGITYHTHEFGDFPGAFIELLTDDDFADARAQHRLLGDTHVTMNLTGAYREPNVLYPERLRNGHDWSNDLPGIKAQVRKAVTAGLFVDFSLGGDGRSVNDHPSFGQYNDPVGDTYGYEWLIQNVERVVRAFRGEPSSEAPDGEDLTRYMIFRPGYDAVFYGWGDAPGQPDQQPARVLAFGAKFRSICPDCYLGIEHDMGHIPVGEGGAEFADGMQAYDALYAEFDNWPKTGDITWQIACRMLGPAYRRPRDQPADDDPGCERKFYLAPGTPRGPYFAIGFEFAKYAESHGRGMTPADVDRARAYYRALGYRFLG